MNASSAYTMYHYATTNNRINNLIRNIGMTYWRFEGILFLSKYHSTMWQSCMHIPFVHIQDYTSKKGKQSVLVFQWWLDSTIKWANCLEQGLKIVHPGPICSLFPHLCPASQIMLNCNLLDGFSNPPTPFLFVVYPVHQTFIQLNHRFKLRQVYLILSVYPLVI